MERNSNKIILANENNLFVIVNLEGHPSNCLVINGKYSLTLFNLLRGETIQVKLVQIKSG
jgi:hypothetical protein